MSSSRIKLLVVDDHAVVRNGVRLMVESAEDIDVTGEAENAQDALRLLREQCFDIALVDIGLSGKNGLELLKAIRVDKPKLAVLIFSMYAEEAYALRALKLGAAGYLTKNSPAPIIVGAIRKAASGGKYISPSLVEKFASVMGGGRLASHETLSDRELEVLKMIASGESLVHIAATLHLSPNTITTYRTRILEKMSLSSNAELARYALENGLLM
ncbi:MAG: response regulator transcription factor [Pseudomonadota bacterium]